MVSGVGYKKIKKEEIQINLGLIEENKTKQTSQNCYVLFQEFKKKTR